MINSRLIFRRYASILTIISCILFQNYKAIAQESSSPSSSSQEIVRLGKLINDLQRRLQILEAKEKSAAETKSKLPKPAMPVSGTVKMGGLIQNWFISDDHNPNTFRTRRMEINLAGELTPRIKWRTKIDFAKMLSLNSTKTGSALASVTPNQASRALQDAVVTYTLTPRFTVDIGQYKIPLSQDSLRPNDELIFVERALFNELPNGNGRIADVRNIGAQISGKFSLADFTIGVFNGGVRQNDVDVSDNKELVARAGYSPKLAAGQKLRLGIYGANEEKGAVLPRRNRIGAELAYAAGAHILEAEMGIADDGSPVARGRGGYVTYANRFSRLWQGAFRWDAWDPNTVLPNDVENDITFGANYFLHGNSKIQFNLVRKYLSSKSPSFLGVSRTQFFVNWQASW